MRFEGAGLRVEGAGLRVEGAGLRTSTQPCSLMVTRSVNCGIIKLNLRQKGVFKPTYKVNPPHL